MDECSFHHPTVTRRHGNARTVLALTSRHHWQHAGYADAIISQSYSTQAVACVRGVSENRARTEV